MGLNDFSEGYAVGYDSAFKDLDLAVKSVHHKDHCGRCRACLFLQDIMNYIVSQVSAHMTKDEEMTVFQDIHYVLRATTRRTEEREDVWWWDL